MSVTVVPRPTEGSPTPSHPAPGARAWTSRATLLLLAATLLALGIRLVAGLGQTGPSVPDEFGYLGQARWLAGGEPMALGPMPYYHVGYALLLVPAAWLGADDPILFWKLVVVTNAFIGAALVPLLTVLLGRLFRVSAPAAVVAAFVASCYPSYVLVAGQAWSEIAVPTVFVLWLLTLQRLLARPTYPAALLAGVAALGVWAVHPRGLPVLAVTPLVLALAVRRGHLRASHAAAAVAALLVVGAGVLQLQALAYEVLWWPGPGVLGQSVESLLRPGAVTDVAALLAGMLWNVLVGTLGLLLLGLLALGTLLRLPTAGFPERATAAAALLAFVGTWVVSAAFFAGAERADQFVYGRYLEGVIPVALAAGVLMLLRARAYRGVAARVGAAGLLLAACALLVWLVRGDELETGLWFPYNASGIMLFGLDADRVQLWTATAVALLAGATALGVAALRRGLGVAVVLGVLLAGVVFVGSGVYRAIDDFWYDGWTSPPVPDDVELVVMTDDPVYWFEHLAYQFWTPQTRFELRPVAPARVPRDTAYVFAPPGWRSWDPGTRPIWENNLESMKLYEISR
jgi:hypothetical protein